MGAEKQYVVFRLMGQLFGAAIEVVREVNHLTTITKLPNTPHFVEGVIDLRGDVLPVIDLRKRLNLPPREADAETRLMVLSLGERSSALIVDGVDQVLTLDTDKIVPPDAHVTLPGQNYVTGLARNGESLVVILDLARLMEE